MLTAILIKVPFAIITESQYLVSMQMHVLQLRNLGNPKSVRVIKNNLKRDITFVIEIKTRYWLSLYSNSISGGGIRGAPRRNNEASQITQGRPENREHLY